MSTNLLRSPRVLDPALTVCLILTPDINVSSSYVIRKCIGVIIATFMAGNPAFRVPSCFPVKMSRFLH